MVCVVIARMPLGSELLFKKLTGTEQLSDCYQLEVETLSTRNAIDLLGEQMTQELRPDAATQRFLSGCMAFVDHEKAPRGILRLPRGAATAPVASDADAGLSHLAANDRQRNSDVSFQAYDIAINNQLEGNFRSWEFFVQYQESAYNFVKRLTISIPVGIASASASFPPS